MESGRSRVESEEAMSGYYPPGVSGFEDEIAGPRMEYDEQIRVECDDCGFSGDVDGLVRVWRHDRDVSWDCPGCGAEHEDPY